MTTEDIIKLLPFDYVLKTQLLDIFPKLDPVKKGDVAEFVWNIYYTLYDLKLEENLQSAFTEAKAGKVELNKDFYKKVREKTLRDMQEEAVMMTEKVDLQQTRGKLQEIIEQARPQQPQEQPQDSSSETQNHDEGK